jgi:O-antigen ligase
MVGLASITAIGLIVEYRTGFNPFYRWGEKLVPGVSPPPDFGTFDSLGRKTIVGPDGHPLAAAMSLTMVLPFAVMGLFRAERTKHRVLYALATALLLGGAVATQRKTALIVPVATLIVLAAYRPRLALKRLPLGFVLIALIVTAAPGALKGVADQLKPSAVTGVLSTKDRVSDYDAIKPDVVNHLFIGRGYDSYDQKRYRILDNQYLTLVVNVGFLGVLAFVVLMFSGMRLAHRCARSRDPDRAWFGPAAVAGILGLTLGSALLDTLTYPQLPYLFCFLAAFATISARGLPSARTEWRESLIEHER